MASVLIDVSALRTALLEVNAEATFLCAGLAWDQLVSRPDPQKWSIAENLVHLGTTTEVFLPTVDAAISATRHSRPTMSRLG